MPIYRYACGACETQIEVIAKMSDPAPARCEACGAEGQMSKLISRTSFQLKGGGWYQQGYEGSSNRSGGASSGGSSSGEASSSASSTSSDS